MEINHPHLAVLRCPRTQLPLRRATPDELRVAAERAVEAGETPPEQGVVSQDGRYLYRVAGPVYVLLAAAALPLTVEPRVASHPGKLEVQRFYDDFGWLEEDGSFRDEDINEDSREVTAGYRSRCNQRVLRGLPPTGKYLLDVASGPVQYDDYLTFSEGYRTRVCVDLSMLALRRAAERLGDDGLFVLGDITQLPIMDGAMDGAVSLHTIYHVPSDQQADAFVELHRVLSPEGRAVVVYSWAHTPATRAMKVFLATRRIPALASRGLRRRASTTTSDHAPVQEHPDLYFAPHTHRWFTGQQWPFRYALSGWRSLSVPVTRAFVADSARGRVALERLADLEERFPHAAGRFGQYPIITIYGGRSGAGQT